MSTTDIYRLGSNPQCIAEIRNSWRGAMFIWDDIAKRYFNMEGFPLFGPMANKIWNAHAHVKMPDYERIVLKTTMDNAIVWVRDLPNVITAFGRYSRKHSGNNSYDEQADALQEILNDPSTKNDAIAWNQTSVNDPWCRQWNHETDDGYLWYDPHTGQEHFDAYAEAVGVVND